MRCRPAGGTARSGAACGGVERVRAAPASRARRLPVPIAVAVAIAAGVPVPPCCPCRRCSPCHRCCRCCRCSPCRRCCPCRRCSRAPGVTRAGRPTAGPLLPLPPPTGGAPPPADDTGMVVVVVVGVVVVVVVGAGSSSWSTCSSRPRSGRRSPSRPRSGWLSAPRSARGRSHAGDDRLHWHGREDACETCVAATGLVPSAQLPCHRSDRRRRRWTRWRRGRRRDGGRRRARVRGQCALDHGTRADAQSGHDRQCGCRGGPRRDEAVADEEQPGPDDRCRDGGTWGFGKRVSERARREDLFQGRMIVCSSPLGLRPPHDPPQQSSVQAGLLTLGVPSPRFQTPPHVQRYSEAARREYQEPGMCSEISLNAGVHFEN